MKKLKSQKDGHHPASKADNVPGDTRDARDTRRAGKSPIVVPPPYQMKQSFVPRRIHNRRNVELARGLERLVTRAAEDSRQGFRARKDLYEILIDSVARMNRLVQKKPEHWRDLAGTETFWPVNVSLHPYFTQGIKKDAAVRDFLERTLRLGQITSVRFDPHSKSKLSSPITYTATELISHVDYARSMQDWLWLADAKPRRIVLAAARKAGKAWELNNVHRLSPVGWRATALTLPSPTTRTAKKQWADVAIEAFLESYPQPEKIQELADEIGAHSPDKDDAVATHRETPERIHKRILARLHDTICDLLADLPS
jgi:hypothetical protein